MRPRESLALAVLLFAAAASAQDVQVEASLDADRVGIQDALTLTVTVSGAATGVSEPELPRLDGLKVAGTSTSTSMSIVNGRMSSSRSFLYELLPQQEGTFEIPAIAVEVGGETYRTKPLTVTVVAGSVAPPRARARGSSPLDPFSPFGRSRAPDIDAEDVFARVELSKDHVYQGEPLVVTYWLYTRYSPLGMQVEDDPPLTGFWVEENTTKTDSSGSIRVVNGREYYAYALERRVLVPTQSGTLTLPPFTFSTAFRVTSGDPWDLLSARSSRPMTLRTEPRAIEVKPLPEAGRESGFSGAVGEFDLEAKLDREEVDAGDAVTLTVSLAGKGSLRAVEAPTVADLAGFRTFDPKVRDETHAGPQGLSSAKSWEYVIVPESGGTKELGPWTLQYFDPESGRYVTASAGPLTLRVAGSAVADLDRGASPDARREVKVLREDIRYLKEPPERLGTRSRPYYESPLFYAALLAPLFWNLGLVVFLRRREREKTHSDVFRSRRAQRMARSRLKRAAALTASGSKDFYEEVAAALYRYVADKSSVSASGLTPSSIDRLLEERGVDAELRRELGEVLARSEEARFTPGERTREEMEALRDRVEALLVSLEKPLG